MARRNRVDVGGIAGGIGIVVAAFAILAAWVAYAAWIIQLNVNDIAAYFAQGQSAPFWPYLWITLIAILTIGGGSKASK